jgi:hypothetical protein
MKEQKIPGVDEEKPRLDVESEAEYFSKRAEQSLAALASSDRRPGRVVPLFNGPEGGPVTERTLAKIIRAAGVEDPREAGPASSTSDGGKEAEATYEVRMPGGLVLRLTRSMYEDGERWIDLDVVGS